MHTYIHICMYIYVCIHVYTYICIHTYIYTYIYIYICTCTHIYINLHRCVRLHDFYLKKMMGLNGRFKATMQAMSREMAAQVDLYKVHFVALNTYVYIRIYIYVHLNKIVGLNGHFKSHVARNGSTGRLYKVHFVALKHIYIYMYMYIQIV